MQTRSKAFSNLPPMQTRNQVFPSREATRLLLHSKVDRAIFLPLRGHNRQMMSLTTPPWRPC